PMHLAYFPAAEVSAANPHNAVLQLAAEWGLPASFLGIACAGIALRRFAIFQRAACTRSPLSVALLCALLGAATQSLVDGVIVMPYTQIFLMVVAGWALGMYWDQVGSDPGRRKISPKFYGIAFAGCIGLLAWKVGTDAPRLVERQHAYVVDHGTYLHPRFWQQGWIGTPEAAVPG